MTITLITEPLHKNVLITHNVIDRVIIMDTRSETQRQAELIEQERVKKLQYGALTANQLVMRRFGR
jgi:hypothetical protein